MDDHDPFINPRPELITIKEAAALCAVSEKWWRRGIAADTCPVKVYRIGKHVRLDRQDILSWLSWRQSTGQPVPRAVGDPVIAQQLRGLSPDPKQPQAVAE